MSAIKYPPIYVASQPLISNKTLSEKMISYLLWLVPFSGAFVLFEPSLYEVLTIPLILTMLLAGYRIPRAALGMTLLLILWVIGGIMCIPLTVYNPMNKAVTFIAISAFLVATMIMFASAVYHNPLKNVELIVKGYVSGAIICAVLAIYGYFSGSELFTLYGRAKGTFNDPNVFAPFLIFPSLILVMRLIAAPLQKTIIPILILMVFAVGIVLAFSRGAWGHLAFSGIFTVIFAFKTARTIKEKNRILFLTLATIFLGGLVVIAVFSLEQVSGLLKERANFDQSYDLGKYGRFGRHLMGFAQVLESPLGIGTHDFRYYYTEDPHNVYLQSFTTYGWLGGVTYIVAVLWTVIAGFRFNYMRTPWQQYYIPAYATFLGLVLEGWIIDTDHWRHFFLLMGIVWGLIAATRKMHKQGAYIQQ